MNFLFLKANLTFPAGRLIHIRTLLIFCGLVLSNHLVLERLGHFIAFDKYFALFIFLAIWFVSLIVIFCIAFTPNRGAKLFWVIVIVLSTLLGETFFQFAGKQLSVAMLDDMFMQMTAAAANQMANPDPANAGLAEYLDVKILLPLLAAALLGVGLIMENPQFRFLKHWAFNLVPVVPCMILVALISYTATSQGRETLGMPSQFYNVSLVTAYVLSEKISLEKSEISISTTKPAAAREHTTFPTGDCQN
jgi:hypothetical protein